jgi:predicted acyltransferase
VSGLIERTELDAGQPGAKPETPRPTPVQSLAPGERLLALDVFRGLTVAGMLLVNNPGSWDAIYPPLEHATWWGWTPTDLIFPFFLFIVGITTHLSREARRERGASERELIVQTIRRGAIIILLGLLMSGFPYAAFRTPLWPGAIFDSATPQLDIAHWRFTGVLNRIGVCYIAAALLTRRTSVRAQVLTIAALLVGYWLALTLISVPGQGAPVLDRPDGSLAAWLDRAVFGTNHLWKGSRTWDPEGILSTFPALATTMLGVLAGRWIASPRPLIERIAALMAVGAIAMTVGLMWNWVFPIGKNLWTSSYVLFTGGMAAVALGVCMWLIDVHRLTAWTRPFVVFGRNPIVAFVGSGVIARLLYTLITVSFDGQRVPLQQAIERTLFASWLDPRDASLAFAICFVVASLALVWELDRRNIILKV